MLTTREGLQYDTKKISYESAINFPDLCGGWSSDDALNALRQQRKYAIVFINTEGKPLAGEDILTAWNDFSNRLGICIIDDFESDRMESGRKELVKGLGYLLGTYQRDDQRAIITETLVTLTGYSLDSLMNRAKLVEIPDEAY